MEQTEEISELELIHQHWTENHSVSDQELDVIADIALGVLHQILDCFGETDVVIDEYTGDNGELIFDISQGDLAILIGRHGSTLQSLQSALSLLVHRKLGFSYPVVVDIEGYKTRRKQQVEQYAQRAAQRVKETQKRYVMKPMSAYERRLVHIILREDEDVQTHSEGSDTQRHVVITPQVEELIIEEEELFENEDLVEDDELIEEA